METASIDLFCIDTKNMLWLSINRYEILLRNLYPTISDKKQLQTAILQAVFQCHLYISAMNQQKELYIYRSTWIDSHITLQ